MLIVIENIIFIITAISRNITSTTLPSGYITELRCCESECRAQCTACNCAAAAALLELLVYVRQGVCFAPLEFNYSRFMYGRERIVNHKVHRDTFICWFDESSL